MGIMRFGHFFCGEEEVESGHLSSLLGHLDLGFLDKLGVGNCWEILTLKIPAWRPIGSTVRRFQD